MIKLKFALCFIVASCVFTKIEAQTIAAQPTLNDQYSKKIGNLRFSQSTLGFGKVANNEKKQDTIRIMNSGKSTINLFAQSKNNFSTVTFSTTKLPPDATGWILIAYDFSKRDEYGFILDRILINSDDVDQPQKSINVTATIHEYFDLTDTLTPKARIPETIYSYGNIQAGEKANHDFLIYNDGVKPLIIRKVKTTCGCIKPSTTKSEIAPGEAGVVHIEFDSFGKDGKDSRIVNVFLNDPMMSEVKLEVNGVVLK